tara:strand:+ start:803 stop:931 length:129 start_codon:yes stop_codon:yes gene_type:complete
VFSLFIEFKTMEFMKQFVKLGVHDGEDDEEDHCLDDVRVADE